MPYVDLEIGRRSYQAMRELVIHRTGGFRDEPSWRKLQDLCRTAFAAVDDLECKEHVGAVEDFGADLYSDAGHQKWARKQMSGADFVRLQVLKELDAFYTRVFALEAMRNYVASQAAQLRSG